MLFPIIKIKDKHTKYEHIVGTNSHDVLYIDEETGGIHYLDLQCMAGTQKYNGESSCEFVGTEPVDYMPYVSIEYVTIEQLIKIAIQNMKDQTESKLKLDEIMRKFFDEQKKCEEKLKDSIPETSGMLY